MAVGEPGGQKLPAGHRPWFGAITMDPEVQKYPAAHCPEGEASAVSPQNCPLVQAEQAVMSLSAVLVEKLPEGQRTGAAEPSGQYEPAGHTQAGGVPELALAGQ